MRVILITFLLIVLFTACVEARMMALSWSSRKLGKKERWMGMGKVGHLSCTLVTIASVPEDTVGAVGTTGEILIFFKIYLFNYLSSVFSFFFVNYNSAFQKVRSRILRAWIRRVRQEKIQP